MNFQKKISDFEKTEQDIAKSIADGDPFVLKKTEDNYFQPDPGKPIKQKMILRIKMTAL